MVCINITQPDLFISLPPTAGITNKWDTTAIPFQHIGRGSEMWKHPQSIQIILNNMAGNSLTVFQFNFIVNNLQFDLILTFLPLMWLRGRGGGRLGLAERGRNGERHCLCSLTVNASIWLGGRTPILTESDRWWRDRENGSALDSGWGLVWLRVMASAIPSAAAWLQRLQWMQGEKYEAGGGNKNEFWFYINELKLFLQILHPKRKKTNIIN